MKVRIISGQFKGVVGHLSYDSDGSEWITFYSSAIGGWRDIKAEYEIIPKKAKKGESLK